MSDILHIDPPAPRRGRGRPSADEATRRRRALAAWLVDSGTLSRSEVELLVGLKTWTVNHWRRQARAS